MKEKNSATANHRPVTPHTILSKTLSTLQEKMEAAGSQPELLDLVQQSIDLISPLDDYLLTQTSPASDALNELEMHSNNVDWDSAFAKAETGLHLEKEMLSGAVEGQFLQLLAAVSNAKNVLEIGSFTGYASLAIAEALPADGKLIACEFDRFTADFARKQLNRSEHGHKVEIRVGDALETIADLSLEKQIFDFIFIDADKQNYTAYYEGVMDQGLLKKGGIVCVDNTLYQGQAYKNGTTTANGDAVKAFNNTVANDSRVQQVLLPLRDGLTVIRRL
ncbi:O-methyltransferase [Nonlabens antarcticus]|uniref:O-methyltransferase n=1 Tax=Nonlabens antarcticus TaxID=392714 RepID=UPI001891C0DD|nr:class I SAM-dependent methyltransferase [Nonlabens antarcticus]